MGGQKKEHEMARAETVLQKRSGAKITFVATRILVYPVLSEVMSRMDFADCKSKNENRELYFHSKPLMLSVFIEFC